MFSLLYVRYCPCDIFDNQGQAISGILGKVAIKNCKEIRGCGSMVKTYGITQIDQLMIGKCDGKEVKGHAESGACT